MEIRPVLMEFEHRLAAVFWAFQKNGSARPQQFVGKLGIGLAGQNVAGADADGEGFPIFGELHPGGAVAIKEDTSLPVEKLEKMRAVVDFRQVVVFLDIRMESFAIALPLVGGADDLGWLVLLRDGLK